MAILPTTPYDASMASVEAKFGHKGALGLKFKDEDGEPVSIRDESDYELAMRSRLLERARRVVVGRVAREGWRFGLRMSEGHGPS